MWQPHCDSIPADDAKREVLGNILKATPKKCRKKSKKNSKKRDKSKRTKNIARVFGNVFIWSTPTVLGCESRGQAGLANSRLDSVEPNILWYVYKQLKRFASSGPHQPQHYLSGGASRFWGKWLTQERRKNGFLLSDAAPIANDIPLLQSTTTLNFSEMGHNKIPTPCYKNWIWSYFCIICLLKLTLPMAVDRSQGHEH